MDKTKFLCCSVVQYVDQPLTAIISSSHFLQDFIFVFYIVVKVHSSLEHCFSSLRFLGFLEVLLQHFNWTEA